ncbi:unnamed protein product [Adineta ricciae]|uniref:Uncharacterized protein n=1 Tax=Adineta ricciae TaxID=249248 RepID=A0A814URF1_ADIRI|nr:unnamed protein product [Adineta ricciae]CAF1178514.1 unnamed protein product [Adineta ricciae]
MMNGSSTSLNNFYNRSSLLRVFLIFAVAFLLSYLFIYKIDVKTPIILTRNILISFSNSSRHKLSNISKSQTDKINGINSSVGNIVNQPPDNVKTNSSWQPKEAFVTFSNNHPSYLALLKVFLDSVHAFSTRPVIAFGIDVDLDIDPKQYPRVIKRRISQKDCGPSVYFCKIHAIVSSNVDYGVLMETDDVVNYNVDILFEVLHVWPYPLPISPRHPTDPRNWGHFARQFNVSRATTPYIHAHIIWNYRALPFLKTLHSLLRQGHFQGSNFDETAVNVMLWRAGANHTMCKYDPYFTYSDAYERWPNITNCTEFCHTAFITLHGCKDAKISAALLTRLKANAGKPTVQLFGIGGMRHINDTTATCCYPDSKRSPIHPLLCEHQ